MDDKIKLKKYAKNFKEILAPQICRNTGANLRKRGQVTIFIIIAILIVVAIVLLFSLYQKGIIQTPGQTQTEPDRQIMQCVERATEEAVNKLFKGNLYIEEAPLYKEFGYKDQIPKEKYPYLCYTPNYRAKCIIQEPVLISHVEKEIQNYIEPKIKDCFTEVADDLKTNGYTVEIESENEMNFTNELLPTGVKIKIQREMKIRKTGSERTFSSYISLVKSPLYDISTTSSEIAKQESKYCNSDYVLIMATNPKIQIEKFQTGDMNKIYTIKDLATGKLIRFAVRGCVTPIPS